MFYELIHPLDADYYTVHEGDSLDFPSHIHACFEVMIVTAGVLEITVDGTTYPVGPGSASLVFPNQIHSVVTREKGRYALCVFSAQLVNSFAHETRGRLPASPVFPCPAVWADRLLTLRTRRRIAAVKGVLYSLCGMLDETAAYTDAREASGDGLLYRIFSFIGENYAEDCSLNRLAAETAYSYVYLSRFFKSSVGTSYHDYVAQYRIGKACHLLRSTEKSVLEIAGDCGFCSQRSLDRRFRAQMGATPTQYRAAHKIGTA